MQLPPTLTLLLLLLLQLRAAAAVGSGEIGSYRVSGAELESKLTGCLIESVEGVNLTSICAEHCRSKPSCESFSFSDSSFICELHSGTAAAAGCSLTAAAGWNYFTREGFQLPQPAIGPCSTGNECRNNGTCLSRTEITANSRVCACKVGFSGDACATAESQAKWSPWSDFGECSVTCGVGLKMRQRKCERDGSEVPSAMCGSGSAEQYQMCNTTVCPAWSTWSSFSPCSSMRTCGEGVRQRSRTCSNGGVIGKDCLGSAVENTPCQSVSCLISNAPVSLLPSNYEPYVVGKGFVRIFNDLYNSEGYVCADGFDVNREGVVVCRSLGFEGVQAGEAPAAPSMPTTPTQQYFLTELNCQGTEASLQSCSHADWSNNTDCAAAKAAYVVCKVNGHWSQWSQWESCDDKCGTAQRNRTRSCRQPKPLGGGLDCVGAAFEEGLCPSLAPCPVHGIWSSWSLWTECSSICGGGNRSRSRTCTAPLHGGSDCSGSSSETEICGTDPCPVDGYYRPWSSWSSCNATCGGGLQQRMRVCVPPANNGRPCLGAAAEARQCGSDACPVAGNWSEWSEWQACNATCGGGGTWRQRQCDNPPPQHGGDACDGDSAQVKQCNTMPCPINGYYQNWSEWSTCTLTCGGGQQLRNRSCMQPQFGGADCSGAAQEARQCSTQPCPIPGLWQNWQAWGHCSMTCDGGVRQRQRHCNMTSFGSYTADCLGESSQTEACNVGVKCLAVRSCQDLKNKGYNHDMATIIDPDGPDGSTEPFTVKCVLSENGTFGYTEVGNNMSLPGEYAQGYESGGSFRIKVNYDNGISATSLNKLAQLSGNCSQYVRYTCHDAGIHYQNNRHLQATYWVNHYRMPMQGWGQPYEMQMLSVCACYASSSCGMMTTNVGGVDTIVEATCHCDRNERKDGVYDDGIIYDKQNLPVNEVWVGDTGDDTEFSHSFVGPLRCWGLDPSMPAV